MEKNHTLFAVIFLLATLPFFGYSQTQLTTTPRVSQAAATIQRIGLTDITVSYHRPAAKGREIWGSLVPDDAIWRAGANENTTLEFTRDVKIEGQKLRAGKYGFFILPSKGKATVIFSKNNSSWGHFTYNQKEDALRVEVDIIPTLHFYEFVTYEFEDIKRTKAKCSLKWGHKKVSFTIESDVDNNTIVSLRHELRNRAGFSWKGWNEAANYCLQNNVNLKEAQNWATRSVFMSPNANNMKTKALITGKLMGNGNAEETTKIALETLKADLSNQPCTWKEWNAAANFSAKNKSYNMALTFVDKAIEMDQNMTTMMSKANILEQKGEPQMAKNVKKTALDKGTNAELNAYGYQLLFSGKTSEAVEVFEANSIKNPKDPNVWDSLCEGYAKSGQKEKAIKAAKKSLSLNPPEAVKANTHKTLRQLGVEVDQNDYSPR